jgi:hypothetical protein
VKIILQCITTTWESGTPAETPLGFELGATPNENESLEPELTKPVLIEPVLIEHNVSLYQLDAWTKPRERSRQTTLQSKTVRDGLLLEIMDDILQVTYTYSPNIGKPERNNPFQFELLVGEWARVTHNGIHIDAFEKKTWYSKIVWNIAHVLKNDPQVFIGSQPKVQHDDTVKLG